MRSRISSSRSGGRLDKAGLARPRDRAPVVDGCGPDGAQSGRDDLEVWELRRRPARSSTEMMRCPVRREYVDAFDLEAQAGGEVLFVADHHVDVSREPAVDLAGAFEPADRFPEAGAVVEVVGDDGAVARAARSASSMTSGVVSESAAKMPPVCSQRTPCTPNRWSQSTCPARAATRRSFRGRTRRGRRGRRSRVR